MADYDNMMQQRTYGGLVGQLGQGAANAVPQPKEPALVQRTHELLGYLGELEEVNRAVRRKLIGEDPGDIGPPSHSPNKRPDEPCLEELIAVACNRAACLVGEQKTILARI